MSPYYTPIADLLPSVYHEDADSFAQLNSYLGLVDEVLRGYAARLAELGIWLSPNGPANQWPSDVDLEAGPDEVLAAHVRLFDELAAWTGFSFPAWWVVEVDGRRLPDLSRRRAYLARSARLWRRRATLRGFLDWLCLAFDIDSTHRPYLLEHFKFGRPGCGAEDGLGQADAGADPGLRATLLMPSTERFDRPEMRRLLVEFVNHYAPAHVHIRVCWVNDDFELYKVGSGDTAEVKSVPGPRPPADDAGAMAAWQTEVDEYRTHIRCLLCALVDEIPHEIGIGVATCIDDGRSDDRLGIGRLPGAGRVPDPSPPDPPS